MQVAMRLLSRQTYESVPWSAMTAGPYSMLFFSKDKDLQEMLK